VSAFIASLATQGCIFSIAVLGLNVTWGWAGDLDLAFYAYIAVGAYMAMVTSIGRLPPPDQYILGWHLPFAPAALIATASAGLLALCVGAVGLRRLRAVYFAVMTLGTALLLHIFISGYRPLFNGFNGLYGMPRPFGQRLPQEAYAYCFLAFCAVLLTAVYLLLERLSHTPFGRSLRAVREDERAAATLGRNAYALKLRAYVLGASLGGLAGAVLAAFLGAFNPTAWAPEEVLDLYVALFVGGRGNSRGAVLGAFAILVLFEESVRFLPAPPGNPIFWLPLREIALGIMILAAMRYRIRGLLPEPREQDHLRTPRVAEPLSQGAGAVG
jgi:branched-chain amino acid transport system permease protein